MKASLAIVLASCLCVQRGCVVQNEAGESVPRVSDRGAGIQTVLQLSRWCAGPAKERSPTGAAGGGRYVQTLTTIVPQRILEHRLVGGYSKQSISKGCVPICPASGVNIGIMAASVNCCSSFLCNISGASSVKSNQLVLAAGMLASLLYLFGPRL
ncbi:Lymphocyte antigen 6E [Varanus komodoensis]|nr:Lymphocyte antigen 6E [Varanus komodoensis]